MNQGGKKEKKILVPHHSTTFAGLTSPQHAVILQLWLGGGHLRIEMVSTIPYVYPCFQLACLSPYSTVRVEFHFPLLQQKDQPVDNAESLSIFSLNAYSLLFCCMLSALL